jgi:hypothetical protein
MSLCGCVLPTALEQVSSQQQNHRPVLIAADKPFGPLTLSAADNVELKIFAEDTGGDVPLVARLFRPGSSGPTSRAFFVEQDLSFPSGTDLKKTPLPPQTATFFMGGSPLCTLFSDGGELYVDVTDGVFTGNGNEVSGGLSDEKFWELKCH